jgi:hypothetical protein
MLLLYSGYLTKHVRTRTCLTQKFDFFCQKKPAEAGYVAGYEFQRHSIVVVDLLDLCPNTLTDLFC